jgi:polar amino acid transport system substrate-binding protein
VGGVEGTATSRALARTLKHATLVLFKEAGEAQRELARGRLDALAQGREALLDFAKKAPGTRVLDDPIVSTSVIVVVPKDRPATREWAARFLEEAKADGTVRLALDGAGFRDAPVAPSSGSSR